MINNNGEYEWGTIIQQKGSATATYVRNSVRLIVVSYQIGLEHDEHD
jgi:hypothetical protein